MLTWENEQDNYLCLLQQYKWNNQNTTDTINHPCAMCIKFHDYSWLFHQSIKKLAIVERLFWQLRTCFRGNCHCREVAVDCPPGQRRVAVVERCPKWRGSHQCRFDCRPFHQFFQLLTWTSLGRSVDITGKSTLKLVNLPTWMGGKVVLPTI